ncbi:hypothetical protein EDC01DRAFT_636658 [Geopyxis carbonaria]|nr:hypothetical protein EDC01DRAFT_636658 [Geopyxis carbonaria]
MPRNTRQNAKLRLDPSQPEVQQVQRCPEAEQATHLGACLEVSQAQHPGASTEVPQAQQSSEAQQAQHSLEGQLELAQHSSEAQLEAQHTSEAQPEAQHSSEAQQATHLGADSEIPEDAAQRSKRSRSRNTRQNAKLRLGASEPGVQPVKHLGTVTTSNPQQGPAQRSKRSRSSFTSVKQRKASKSGNLKVPKHVSALETKHPKRPASEQDCRQVPNLHSQSTVSDPIAKKKKDEIELDFSYLLQFTVSCGQDHKVVNEGGVHDAHPDRRTFNFTAALEREKTAVASHERSSKKSFTKCEPMEGGIQATVALEGKGQHSTPRTVREAADWIEVEKIIHYYITSKRKISQVTLHAKYEETIEVQGHLIDEDSPNTEDDQPKVILPLNASSASAVSSTAKIPGVALVPNLPRKRKPFTEQERAKALAAQANGENYVVALHQRWRDNAVN